MSNDVATTILAQLGGRRACAMIGAKSLVSDGPALIVKFKARAKEGINAFKVTLDPCDTYTVEFWAQRGLNVRKVASCSDVYADSLRTVIEAETGLYLSL